MATYAPLSSLVVRASPTHGLGVFATEPIAADTVVERSAILESLIDRRHVACGMERYMYASWKEFPHIYVMPSGFGTMYNDAGRCANVRHELDMNQRLMSFVAVRDIEPGEELRIDYQQTTRQDILRGQ